MSIFSYLDYKPYLADRLQRGEKSSFARAVGCSPSYLSQVLAGKPHLALEQGVRANKFLAHSKNESKYFMLILQISRAGSLELEDFYREQAMEYKREQEKIKSQIVGASELGDQAKAVYYSSWIFPALHMLLCLPGAADLSSTARKLGLSRSEVEQKIELLTAWGLVKKKKSGFELNFPRVHLSTDSPHLTSYHSQSRLCAMEKISRNQETDLHFSSFICHSREDAARIRKILMEAIGSVERVYRPSKEEAVFGFNLDYYEI